MYQFPTFPLYAYVFSIQLFRNLRIAAWLRLPEAYRS